MQNLNRKNNPATEIEFSETTYNLDAEETVLANVVLMDTESLEFRAAIEQLSEEDFYDPRNGKIFTAIKKIPAGRVDPICLVNYLYEHKQKDIGDYFMDEVYGKRTGSAKSTKYHAEIVRNKSLLRKTIAAAHRIIEQGSEHTDNIDETIEKFALEINELRKSARPKNIISRPLNEFMQMDLPKPEYVLYPIMETHNEIIVHADAGVGKSLFITEIGYAIATGGNAFKWHAPKARNVLIVDGEMPKVTLQQRYRELLARNGNRGTDNLHLMSFMDFEENLDLTKPYWQSVLNQRIEELGIDVLILDNLDSLFNLDQNKQVDWQPAQAWLKRLRGGGISTILVHHSNKQNKIFGTSALSRQPNAIMALIRPEEYDQEEGAVFDVKFDKGRQLFAEKASTFRCRLTPEGWTIEDSPRSVKGVKKQIIESIENGNTHYKDIADDLEKSNGFIRKTLSIMSKEKLVEGIGKGHYQIVGNIGNNGNKGNIGNIGNIDTSDVTSIVTSCYQAECNEFEEDISLKNNDLDGQGSDCYHCYQNHKADEIPIEEVKKELIRIVETYRDKSFTPGSVATGLNQPLHKIVVARRQLQEEGYFKSVMTSLLASAPMELNGRKLY